MSTPRPVSIQARMQAILDEATSRARDKADAEAARRAKGSAGLPPPDYRRLRGGGSVVTKSKRTTTGKHHSH